MLRRVNRETVQKTIGDIVDDFDPDKRGPDSISTLRYRIPAHQRYHSWKKEEQESLIISVLANRAFGCVVLIERVDPETNLVFYDFEDGQSRLTVLWKFYKNDFSVGEPARFYSDFSEEEKIAFKTYTFGVDILRNCTEKEIIEIFDNLNTGKTLSSKDWYFSRSDEKRIAFTVKLYNEDSNFKMYIGDNFSSKPAGRVGLEVFTCINISVARAENERLTKNFRANCRYLDETFGEPIIKAFWAYFFEIAEEAVEVLPLKSNGKRSIRRIGKSSMKFYIPLVFDWNADIDQAMAHKPIWVKYMRFYFEKGASAFDAEVFKGLSGSVYSETTRKERLEKILQFFTPPQVIPGFIEL